MSRGHSYSDSTQLQNWTHLSISQPSPSLARAICRRASSRGSRLGYSEAVRLTTIAYVRRRFLRDPTAIDPEALELSCWYLSGKIEECEDPTGKTQRGVDLEGLAEDFKSNRSTEKLVEDAIRGEMDLLGVLDFELLCYHPWITAVKLWGNAGEEEGCPKLELREEIFQGCADCYVVNQLIFQYPSSVLAVVAVCAAIESTTEWNGDEKTAAKECVFRVLEVILGATDEVAKSARKELIAKLVQEVLDNSSKKAVDLDDEAYTSFFASHDRVLKRPRQ